VPDPLAPVAPVLDPVSLAGPEFARCVALPPRAAEQETAAAALAGLALDPRDPADLAAITALQERLVALADRRRDFVVLLDVPPGLEPRAVERWRARFRSSYAAAYHPWLWVARPDDLRDGRVLLNPSAVAAGVIARQELAFGIPHGPANVVAAEVVDVAERVSPARHDALHQAGVNVFLAERDGVMLTAGRTLAADPRYRQLTVRRLMLMLRRTLEREMQWAVFEPNGRALQAEIRNLLRAFLRRLYRAGAFRGATEREAFFVRCDAELNPPRITDAGRLVAEVGVAPSEPVEFLVLRLTREGDGTLAVEE
jgi:phage tail sheath protein FI